MHLHMFICINNYGRTETKVVESGLNWENYLQKLRKKYKEIVLIATSKLEKDATNRD